MSFSTDLFCRISFIRATYNNLSDVEEDIKTFEKQLYNAKYEIRDLVMMTEPEKMFKAYVDRGESAYDIITDRLNYCFEAMKEASEKLFKLEHLRDNWDACHETKSGLAIPLPDSIDFDAAFLDGDYVKTIKNKNGYE